MYLLAEMSTLALLSSLEEPRAGACTREDISGQIMNSALRVCYSQLGKCCKRLQSAWPGPSAMLRCPHAELQSQGNNLTAADSAAAGRLW